jgi:hypothetical protein
LCCECHSLRKPSKTWPVPQPGAEVNCLQLLLAFSFSFFFFFLFLPQGKNRKEMCVKECSLLSFCGDCVSYEKASKVPGAVCLFM